MHDKKNIHVLIKNVKPKIQPGQFVFVTVSEITSIPVHEILALFREEEGITLIIKREMADQLSLDYSFIASWISLNVHSSLDAVGLTAKVSDALTQSGISCNALAAYYHDHIFVPYREADKAMAVLRNLK